MYASLGLLAVVNAHTWTRSLTVLKVGATHPASPWGVCPSFTLGVGKDSFLSCTSLLGNFWPWALKCYCPNSSRALTLNLIWSNSIVTLQINGLTHVIMFATCSGDDCSKASFLEWWMSNSEAFISFSINNSSFEVFSWRNLCLLTGTLLWAFGQSLTKTELAEFHSLQLNDASLQ